MQLAQTLLLGRQQQRVAKDFAVHFRVSIISRGGNATLFGNRGRR